jgi:dipeptidyl aminopeptidase/acylaminoacyl peptidase
MIVVDANLLANLVSSGSVPPRGRKGRSLGRYPAVSLVARFCALAPVTAILACATGERPGRPAAADSVFTPTRYSVADFYGNTEYGGASFSPSADRILVSSNRSGVYNAYAIPVAGGAPEALTHSTDDAIFAVSWFPADDRILYSRDQGGNELNHLYVRTADGESRDLTPGAKLKAAFDGWSGDDRSFFVETNERDPRYFDLYEYATDGYARKLIYRNTEGYTLGPISRDKRYLALVRPRTTNDADVFLHDRRAGTTTHITRHTGDINYSPQDFAPDGSRLLLTSDSGREFTALRAYDIATRQTSPVYQLNWDILGAGYSKHGKYLTVYVNEDSRPDARLFDATTMQPVELPGMPPGVVRGISLSRDESTMAFYASDGSVPDELWAGRLGQAPGRLTSALNPRIRREDLVVPRVARFKSYDGLEIPGLLYRPHQASPAARAPAIVMVHGGPGGQAQVGYFALTQALVNHGYVVYDINNRGSSGYGKTFYAMDDRRHGEADLGDVVASKRMLAATGYVDSARIGILGGSYGGYMTLAALTLRPDAFRAGVDLFGISNWVRTLTSIPPWWASFREALYAEMGDPGTDSSRLRRISPLFNADRIRAPLMVLQGANDPRVLKVESDEIVAAVKRRGVPVEYVVFDDEGHGFVKKANEIEGYSRVLEFLDRYLKGKGTAGG